MTDHNIWPGITSDDALGMRAWLKGLGFTEGILVPLEDDESGVRHSEMIWPEGGRVMVSTRGHRTEFTTPNGSQNIYVVCDDPDAVFERAQQLGADVVQGLEETDYGSRGFAVRDPDGGYWSFGTYAG